jgi:PAS domain S-box-containing protein
MSGLLKIETAIPSRGLASLMDLDQAILDAIPMGVYACNADGLIMRVNARATQLWGRTPRLLDPTQLFCGTFRLNSLDGQIIPPDQTPMARAVLHGESARGVEAIVVNPDNTRWVVRVDVEPLRDASGVVIGAINCFQDVTKEYAISRRLQRQQKTFELAMIASQMGTWRYTLADNICVYDKNAQELYGLTEARFLHDEAGVAAKFHPEDLQEMWAGVARALDSNGDGRYGVEYRAKQRDGSWRWLTTWGIVEFEGDGSNRKVVAIAGASRDITERKKAEELQRVLLDELSHRVKNSLAIVQSIAAQTLRGATDIDAARKTLDSRIIALAQAHELLTSHNWTGAHLSDVVARAMQPFETQRIEIAGTPMFISARHALALSMALHELATNAAKYGALSGAQGNLDVRWKIENDCLYLNWREANGPPVKPPLRRGFGTHLLEAGIFSDLGGHAMLAYHEAGLQCAITVPLSVAHAAPVPQAISA